MRSIALLLALGSVVQAQDASPSTLGNAVNWATEPEWTVRAGVDLHQFTFKTGVAGKSEWKGFFNRTSGRGDVGLVTGRRKIVYDDGFVDGRTSNFDDAMGTINSPSQVSDSGRKQSFGMMFSSPLKQLSFHSSSSSEELRGFTRFHSEQEDTATSAAIEMGRHLGSFGRLDIGVSLGWAASSTNQTSRPTVSGFANTLVKNRSFTYSYDFPGAYALRSNSYPENEQQIYIGDSDPVDPSGFDPAFRRFAPRKSSKTANSQAIYAMLTSGHVDMTMQTVSFATEFSWKAAKRLELGLSVGPTLNVASTSTSLTTDVIRNGDTLVAHLVDRQDKTQVLVGLRMLATARYDLTSNGRWFVEAHGGYEWMQPIKLGIGLQDASVDASSWHVGMALGYRL